MDTQYFADPQLAELHAVGAAMAKSAFHAADLSQPIPSEELHSIFASLARTGYLGGRVDKADGGAGMSGEEFGALLEGVAEAAPYLSNHNVQREIALAGSTALKDRWLGRLLDGSAIGTIAVTEPSGGSDLEHLHTRVETTDDGYKLTGQKLWAVHTMTADVAIVLAEGPEGEPMRVVADLNHESVRRQQIPTSGLRFLTFGLLQFMQTPIYEEDVLKDVDDDAIAMMVATDRALTAIQATSVAQRAIHAAVKQLSTRRIRGTLVTDTDVIRAEIGRMSAAVEAARVFAYHALKFIDLQQPGVEALAAGAKSHATDVCSQVCNEAVELCAAEGLLEGSEVIRLRNDLQMLATGHGTSLVNALKWGEYVIDQSQIRR